MMIADQSRKMLLGGKWVEKEEKINVFDPQDNRVMKTVPKAGKEDMLLAIKTTEEGREIAKQMSVHERINVMNRRADYMEQYQVLYAEIIAKDGSKAFNEARDELTITIQKIRISAEEARRIKGETIPFDQMPGTENRIGYYYKFPIGIIAAITPFNDPLNLVAHKIGPAIASGNAIIVKPATL